MGELVTVYTSADETAADNAAEVLDILAEAGLNPAMYNENSPGVGAGTYEVRVPAEEVEQAEALLAEGAEENPSHEMDLVEVYQGVGIHAEMEALGIRAVLDASHIPNVIVGTSQMPNLPFSVRVPVAYEALALAAVESARAQALKEGEPAG